MFKKKMSIQQKLATSPNSYLPAQLVKGRKAGREYWYIKFYQTSPITGKRSRYRETMDLNRIKTAEDKTAYAKDLIQHINSLLPYGYPYHDDFVQLKGSTSIRDAIIDCQNKVVPDLSVSSAASYDSMYRIFLNYLIGIDMNHKSVSLYGPDDAQLYMNHIITERKVSNNTYNNYLTQMNVLFNKMISEKYITINPFADISRKNKSDKIRRGLHDYEIDILIDHMRDDKELLLCVLLQYYCFIRPTTELRKLRFQHFDLNKGCIILPPSVTKNSRHDIITIPSILIQFLIDYGFNTYPGNYLLYGPKCKPHPTIPCGKNTIGLRHRTLLKKLNDKNILTDIKGIQLYSWKDTGALAMVDEGYNILDIQKQMRHSSLSITEKYIKSLHDINPNITTRKKSLI